jgi:hypothetical protein
MRDRPPEIDPQPAPSSGVGRVLRVVMASLISPIIGGFGLIGLIVLTVIVAIPVFLLWWGAYYLLWWVVLHEGLGVSASFVAVVISVGMALVGPLVTLFVILARAHRWIDRYMEAVALPVELIAGTDEEAPSDDSDSRDAGSHPGP